MYGIARPRSKSGCGIDGSAREHFFYFCVVGGVYTLLIKFSSSRYGRLGLKSRLKAH